MTASGPVTFIRREDAKRLNEEIRGEGPGLASSRQGRAERRRGGGGTAARRAATYYGCACAPRARSLRRGGVSFPLFPPLSVIGSRCGILAWPSTRHGMCAAKLSAGVLGLLMLNGVLSAVGGYDWSQAARIAVLGPIVAAGLLGSLAAAVPVAEGRCSLSAATRKPRLPVRATA